MLNLPACLPVGRIQYRDDKWVRKRSTRQLHEGRGGRRGAGDTGSPAGVRWTITSIHPVRRESTREDDVRESDEQALREHHSCEGDDETAEKGDSWDVLTHPGTVLRQKAEERDLDDEQADGDDDVVSGEIGRHDVSIVAGLGMRQCFLT